MSRMIFELQSQVSDAHFVLNFFKLIVSFFAVFPLFTVHFPLFCCVAQGAHITLVSFLTSFTVGYTNRRANGIRESAT